VWMLCLYEFASALYTCQGVYQSKQEHWAACLANTIDYYYENHGTAAPGTTISGPLPASTMTIRGNAQKIIVFHHLTSGDVRVQNLRFLASPKEVTL
jgi:hypothetical protein